MHNAWHKPKAFVNICDISIRHRDPADRIVIA